MTNRSLWQQVTDFSNLYRAFRLAARGRRQRASTAAFEFNLEENLIALQDELREKTYQPGSYTHFLIHDPKTRLISAAPFRDRVVHHALIDVIEPIFERKFIDASYVNRIGKVTHKALNRYGIYVPKY